MIFFSSTVLGTARIAAILTTANAGKCELLNFRSEMPKPPAHTAANAASPASTAKGCAIRAGTTTKHDPKRVTTLKNAFFSNSEIFNSVL